ncbi:probable G-protein coupled receptor Mth-like 12 isoform X2 [Drosophila gunungcola]|uniref:probable G-protein coupled receptor Mth-like 12 isoform X2 n=1 Tax=Drosophila gunungcola TaxID=103775 RepID=UPI0022DE9A4A|nr:probable G-protein coupled receptor Mth-like 12 isoform X2 [Drosophila gunungcola]
MTWSFELIAKVTSLLCLVFTISVYLMVKNLRNVLGKCLISSLICLGVFCFITVAIDYNGDYTIFIVLYFWSTAYHIWNYVISFHLWTILSSPNRDEPRYQFLIYSAFVWIAAFIFTLVIYFKQISGYDLPVFTIIMRLTISIIAACSVITFFRTSIYIWKVMRKMNTLTAEEKMMTNFLNFDSETNIQFMWIFFITGIFWVQDVTCLFLSFFCPMCTNILLENFILYFGILIFVMLIPKRSIVKMLMDSIRKTPKEQCVRESIGLNNLSLKH